MEHKNFDNVSDVYYSVRTLKNISKRNWAFSYEQPFKFNIVVNDMYEVQKHIPTKYQFIGDKIYDKSSVIYMSSSAPDRTCKVAQVRSAKG